MSRKMNFKRVLLCALILFMSVIDMTAHTNIDSTEVIVTELKTDSLQSVIEDVIDAIVYVESRGNCKAVNGSCCGPMQISPGMVKACNNILKENGISDRFTLADRFNMEKSKEMFRIFNRKYNPSFDMNKAIRSWNGGLGYKTKSTQGYYNKVMKRYNQIHNKQFL